MYMNNKIKNSLSYSPFDFTVQSLALKKKNNTLIFDKPFYRGDIWDIERKTALIESMLLRIPLSPIWFQQIQTGETLANSYIIPIDGSQRLQTVFQFYNNEFKLTGCKLFSELDGKAFEDLNYRQRTSIEDGSFKCYILRPETEKELVYEIYKRLVTGGVNMSKKDLQKAIKILSL